MTDGAGGQTEVSRQDLYRHYVHSVLRPGAEVQPCRDPLLLEQAAQYLRTEPGDPSTVFTVFSFYQAVTEGHEALSTDCRQHLSAFIRATQLLETLCLNLCLHPWKKEIKTLKTFTGPFVYCLLPVLSNSTIQSVLASIGYLPSADAPQSEYRLCDDANTDKAMLVGFELLLARVECYHLLELLKKDQLGPQELLEVLRRREQPTGLMEHLAKMTAVGQKEEEEDIQCLDCGGNKAKLPLYFDAKLAVMAHPKPRRSHLISVDKSIMEMQQTYPDLAFRGRRLLPDKPPKAHSSSTDVWTAELPQRDSVKGSKAAAATTVLSRNDEDSVDAGRGTGCNDRTSDGSAAPGDTVSSTDETRVDDELSGPQAISLHITLRAGSKAERSQKPGDRQPTSEPPPYTQQLADRHNKRHEKAEVPSLSYMDEEQELRGLAERMGQLGGQENDDEVKRKEDDRRGEENVIKELRKKSSPEGEAATENHADRRRPSSSQSDQAAMKEQKKSRVGHPSLLPDSPADRHSAPGDGSRGPPEREEEPVAQSFVIL